MWSNEPRWWYGGALRPSWHALILKPFSAAYAAIVRRRFENTPSYRSALPVVCIGNFTAGGTGKTPMAIEVAGRLKALGHRPAFLSRGYGGLMKGPLWIDPASDTAHDVGDEPLLLAAHAPIVVARDRAAGARLIETAPDKADVIVMDDGMQNPSLAKDLVLALVDGGRGIGNGCVLPSGPLRADLEFQFQIADAVIVTGPPQASDATGSEDARRGAAGLTVFEVMRSRFAGPVLRATTHPQGDVAWLEGTRLLAFAGIANPGRFFRMLEQLGATVAVDRAFPDHHGLSEAEASELLDLAQAGNLKLVTTAKDRARLAGGSGALARLLRELSVVEIAPSFLHSDEERLNALLSGAIEKRRSSL